MLIGRNMGSPSLETSSIMNCAGTRLGSLPLALLILQILATQNLHCSPKGGGDQDC